MPLDRAPSTALRSGDRRSAPAPWLPGAVSAVVVAAAGCFGPSLPAGIECATTGLCPEGLSCRDGLCVEPGPFEVDPDAAASIDCEDWTASGGALGDPDPRWF